MKMSKSKRKSADKKMLKNLDEKFATELNEQQRFGNEKIIQKNIGEADLEYMRIFGANKNLYRSIASMVDGLKPGHRRLLYSWYLLENKPTLNTLGRRKFIKVDKLSSNTVIFHPHGTSAIDKTIGTDGQYWSNNVMFLDPQGSYGNMAGDTPSAGRYREARISEFTIDCFFDEFDKYCVPMRLGYDGVNYEPDFLPAKYPVVLFNPQFSGIGYGLSSNIPSFNVAEVLDATIRLIKHPKEKDKILLIPDIPTKCDILDEGNFEEINAIGNSKLTMRATYSIDYEKNVIKITSLPLNSSSASVIGKILAIRDKKDKDFEKITEIKDYTKEGEVNIELYLKSDAKPDKIVRKLFKKSTGLKSTFPVGITVIDDFQEYEFGIRDLLLEWIQYRQDVVTSMFLNKLQVLIQKQHMNEVLLFVFNKDNIDKTIKIAKTSKSKKETVDRLMAAFNITSLQAGTIADMHVYNFNEDSYNKYKEEEKELKKDIDEINDILEDDKKIDEFIIKQLEAGKKKWGRERLSRVVKESDDVDGDIPDTDHLLGISDSGFAKKISINHSSIGPIGKSNSNVTVLDINNRENILVIDSSGRVVKISVSAIPDMKVDENGIELKRFFSTNGKIVAVMELPSMKVLDASDRYGIIFVTKKGYAKKVKLSEFKKVTDYKSGISLNDDDEVASAIFTVDEAEKDIIISTNTGNGVHLSADEVRELGASAKGVSMISLKDDEEVVSASLINPKKKFMFMITTQGRAKVIESKYFPVMKRKDSAVNLIHLIGTETLLGISSINKNDVVEVYHKIGEPEQIKISELDVSARVAKGTRVITTGRGDSLVGYKVFKN